MEPLYSRTLIPTLPILSWSIFLALPAPFWCLCLAVVIRRAPAAESRPRSLPTPMTWGPCGPTRLVTAFPAARLEQMKAVLDVDTRSPWASRSVLRSV